MFWRNVFLAILLVIFLTGIANAIPDPGIPDTVKIEGGPLKVGQSVPLYLTIVNDENLGGYSLGHIFSSLDGGFAICDSVVYINRMADPNVLAQRSQHYWNFAEPGSSPDSFMTIAAKYSENPLGPGNGPIMKLYFTALSPGIMSIDSAYFPPALEYLLSTNNGFSIYPQFKADDIEIIEGTIPPTIDVIQKPDPAVAGDVISFDVIASSPEDFQITLNIVSLNGYDDETITPVNPPTLSSGNPAEFQWQTTTADIGIWETVIQVCDSVNNCTSVTVVIQLLESEKYLFGFELKETPDAVYSTGLCHGNFDDDANPEIFSTGSNYSIAQLYDFNEVDSLEVAYEDSNSGFSQFGPAAGFINSDANLDVITMRLLGLSGYTSFLMLGIGDNSFQTAGLENDGHCTRSTCLGELTGDNHLDFASTWYDGVSIYEGDGNTGFSFDQVVNTGDSALSVNCADFNGDGRDDLAIGTTHKLLIYLANGSGGFDLAESYPQTYGSMEIEVTNQGSDFNDDNIFDLCISTPSVGGTYSQMMLYLGNGDGSFSQNSLRTVKGQIFGNCVGDMNNDGHLDIVYINGAKRYVAVLFGDGQGNFENEIRFDIPHEYPKFVECTDIDLDGDIDLVVAANGSNVGENSVFLLLNDLNPGGFLKKHLELTAMNNAEIELKSPTGRIFNSIKNTMPSGDFYRKNTDGNGIMDIYSCLGVVESGRYILNVGPKPDLPAGTPFTLKFVLNGKDYRLAEEIPMSADGYRFGINPDLGSGVMPVSGSFIYNKFPHFQWAGSGDFDFQLANDIDFNSLIVSEIVTGSEYQLSEPLEGSETSIYYWRVKAHDAPDYDCIYAVNILAGVVTDCGDANTDGSINISDAIFLINYVFTGGPAPDPLKNGDTNCTDGINVSDAVYIINFVFIGGAPPCDLNADDVPDC